MILLAILLSTYLPQFQVLSLQPRFTAYWESQLSYLYNDDELNNPWHIDLGNIDVGPLGYLGGPNVVTIDSADYCVELCQEHYQDEFCSKYPPEGVPNKPRVVDDWGTKYNITANMLEEGIKSIHQRGGKVILAYGGTLETYGVKSGITAMYGGGAFTIETSIYAWKLANRIYKNIQDWDLDGVDFFFAGEYVDIWSGRNGYNAAYHRAVIMELRELVGSTKTISYTTIIGGFGHKSFDIGVIASCHPFLDYINIGSYDDESFTLLEMYGVPLNKVGLLLWKRTNGIPDTESAQEAVKVVKERGLSGLSLFSINKENERFRGQYARMVAGSLYS